MTVELVIRFDYGSIIPWVRQLADGGGMWPSAGPTPCNCVPRCTCRARTCRHTVAEFLVPEGTWSRSSSPGFPRIGRGRPGRRPGRAPGHAVDVGGVERTLDVQGDWPDAVCRSLITLKALTYDPTGGIVAAADHVAARADRRRAQLGLPVLLAAGRHLHPLRPDGRRATRPRASGVARLAAAGGGGRARELQIMYGAAGERRLTECEVDLAAGLRGLGAGADRQRRRASSSSTCTARSWTPCTRPSGRARDRRNASGAPDGPPRLPRGALAGTGRGDLGGAGPGAISPTRR